MEMEKMLKAKEVAQILGLTVWGVHNMARRGEIPAYKVGGVWRFKKSEIEEWLKSHSNLGGKDEGD